LPDHLKDAGEDTIIASATFTTDTLNENLSLKVSKFKLDKDIVEAWFQTSTVDGLLVNDWLSKLEKNTADKIISIAHQSLIEGRSAPQMGRLIRKEGIEGSVRGKQGFARTFTHSASHYAKERVVQDKFADGYGGRLQKILSF